ncbi:sensor histidine kinase [Shouchella shacheensis]|uniref:sensor histidine kinase n=1 Tax=Shouchella shacheensis TaxID=1649580 RepID=UPI00074051DB|nr:sensor histidine kinase [Shouchella shacheensis]
MKKQLARLQWQFVRYSMLLCFIIAIVLSILLTYNHEQGLLLLIQIRLGGLPVLVWLLIAVLLSGAVGGFLLADPLKRRIETLVHGVMLYERGSFNHRIEVEGDDELTELAERLNAMSAQMEEKVASLQRLSVKNASMEQSVKKAAVTEERQRLARDLHDAVSQQLFAISMMAAAMKETLTGTESYRQMMLVEKMAGDAQAEMRALLLHLRPAQLEGKSLEQGLEQLFNELEQKQTIQIIQDIEGSISLPPALEDQLFRFIQEAFSNILRHAKASTVEFQLLQLHQQWRLRIVDDGTGFELKKVEAGSYGLQTMRERIHEFGGTVQINSAPTKGTQIEAKIPVAWEGNDVDSSAAHR